MLKCRICKNELKSVLNLGYHPPSDKFLKDLTEPETWYPLELFYCDVCGLAQINYVVDPEILFTKDYPYTTGINKAGIKHFTDFGNDVIEKFGLDPITDFIVDIGGNDGTLLKPFFDAGFKALVIDPSGIDCCVPSIKDFWGLNLASFIREKYGKAKVILTTNCFAHVDDIHSFMKGVKVLLDDNGVFIIESPCLDDMLNKTQFDQIYHEHLSYFNEKPVRYLMDMHDMEVFDIQHNEMHGGSNRYFVRRR